MDQNKLFIKIKELGHVHSKREVLRELCQQKFDLIIKLLPRRIVNSDGGDILDCILNGLPDNAGANKKVKVIEVVLKTMRKESTSLTHCGEVTSRLCLELPRLPVEHLVRWSNDSVQSIVDDSDVNMIWRDVLPECMCAISSHDSVTHCGSEQSSAEYKQQVVLALCQCQWRERQLAQLTAMFKDMQLSREHHKQVVHKICSYMMDVPPDALPPLLHQLLKLCKTQQLETVLAHLAHYFSARLYSKLEPPPQDSESTTLDVDDIVSHSPAELSRCLSTCLFHVTAGAVAPELVRKALRQWPRSQLLRAPFVVDLALAMADKGPDFRTVCLEVVRAAIEARVCDEVRSRECAWVRAVVGPDVDVAALLKVLTTESANHRQLTVMGLIQLAFLLLGTSRVKGATAPACWSHGKLILVRLAKAQPECAPHILAQLADRLAGDTAQTQYSDCLYVLCKLSPVSVERCTQLGGILESCQPSPTDYRAAAAVLDAVHPLLGFSTRSRDTLVMVCRKGLYSRDSQHRCLALSGFLSVLRHVKLSGGSGGSSQQLSEGYSAHSYLTQLTVDLHATQQGTAVTSRVRNEAMCMEVVAILRRCLAQDALVRQLLYTQLYWCAKDKPSLHESILELLLEQVSRHLPDAGAPRLQLDTCVQLSATTATLTEPIGWLLYVVAQFLQPAEEDLEDILASQSAETASAHLKSKLAIILDQLCAADNLADIDMEEPGLSDLTPESRAKCLKVQQLLQSYEALIAHQLMQCNNTSTDTANKILKLFKACVDLTELAKTPSKGKKGNKSLNETKETIKTTQKSQKSQKSQKEKGKAPVKLGALVKERAGPFKALPCLWDLQLCVRVVDLLYSADVSWCSAEQRNQLRVRRELHVWALRRVQAALGALSEYDRRIVATHCANVANVLYTRCIRRFQDMCEFDDQTTLCCLELFKTCLTLLFSPNYGLKMDAFLAVITESSEPSAAAHMALILESILGALQHLEAEGAADERDQLAAKQHALLTQLAACLLEVPVPANPALTTVVVKLEDFVRGSKRDTGPLLGAVLAAGARDQQDAPLLDDLLARLAIALGKIDEEDTSVPTQQSTEFSGIDARSGHAALAALCAHLGAGHAALAALCAHLGARLRSVEHLLVRARGLAAAHDYSPHAAHKRLDRELAEVYKAVVVQLCQLAGWAAGACRLRCAVGAGSERVLGAAVRLYAALAALARQIDVAQAQHVRFERLLKLSGKKLSTATDNLITYLEGSQARHDAGRVLRDTKLIPRLVLNAELFHKRVILLANKAHCNWQQFLPLGTARDFRIKAPVLEHALHTRTPPHDADGDDHDDVDINDAATEIVDQLSDADADDDADADADADADSDHEPAGRGAATKRRRVS